MKKAKTGKAGKKSKQKSFRPKRVLKQVDLGVVQEQITNLVGNRAVEMVETTIEEVGKGHYLAMKCLFELIGLSPASTSEEAPEEDSLAKVLLRRLKLPEEVNPGSEVTKVCDVDTAALESDAVE